MLKKYFIGTFAVAAFAFAISASAAYDFGTTTLKVGSKGEAVKTLQTLVGATPADGVFGKMTAAKVKVWQAANGLTADGVFGNASKAKANESATTGGTTGATCPNGMLLANNCAAATTGTPVVTGAAGDVTITSTSTDVEDKVNEGAKDIKVAGFKAEASGSDISLTNVKVTLTNTGYASSNYRPTNYANEVSVWMGSTKVGSANLADFTKSGYNYSKSIALTGATVKMGVNSKATFYVAVSALPSIDTTDMTNDAWTVTANNVRFVDGTGVVMTDSTTVTSTFDFQSQATSGDVKVVVSKATTSPNAQNVIVSTTASTKNVSLLDFKVKTTGSTVSFDSLATTITLTATGALSELQLVDGSGATIATLDASAYGIGAATRTFTLDDTKTIAANTTETFKITGTINKGVVANFASGASVTATFLNFAPEDSNGDVISDTGSATGATQSFVYAVPTISLAGSLPTPLVLFSHTDGTTTGLEDSYKATIAFNITAPEDAAVYVPLDTFAYGTNGTAGVLFTKTGGATVTSTSVQYIGSDSLSSITEGSSYRIDAGSTQKFELNVYLTGNDVSGKIAMTGLWYELSDTTPNGSPLVSGLSNLYTQLTNLAK